MTNAQQEIQAVISQLDSRIADIETRLAALKDVREAAQDALAKYSIVGMTAQEAIERVNKARIYAQSDEFKNKIGGMVWNSSDWKEDKDLPSSGIYADESEYSESDKQSIVDNAIISAINKGFECLADDISSRITKGVIGSRGGYQLPSSGIYADESGYTAEDKAAALVHDAELDPRLVDICSRTTIYKEEN